MPSCPTRELRQYSTEGLGNDKLYFIGDHYRQLLFEREMNYA